MEDCFRKDRANGEGADEFIDMVNKLMQEDEEPSTVCGSREGSPINLDEPPTPKPAIPIVEDSVGNSTYSTSKHSKTGEKKGIRQKHQHSSRYCGKHTTDEPCQVPGNQLDFWEARGSQQVKGLRMAITEEGARIDISRNVLGMREVAQVPGVLQPLGI